MSAGGSTGSKGPYEPDGELTDDTCGGTERRGGDETSPDDQPSSSYLDPAIGDRPSSLYRKYTWRVPNYSAITKRELRSKSFSVGEYPFYILVYPTGCGEARDHLSLFLCVADHDKMLPGWSHLAQFTVALVHKDPKLSKYSDTLHRFCKKEHDWGWKRFMEVGKVLDDFMIDGTLTIKAQVQVIRDSPLAPFRCLDSGYRRELLRVYSSNVDSLCTRFLEERRTQLQVLLKQLPAFRSFWAGLPEVKRLSLVSERSDIVLKGIVKRFFNDREVTSTLLMDALFSGCHQIEAPTAAGPSPLMAGAVAPVVCDSEKGIVSLQGDLLALLQSTAAQMPLPPASDQEPLVARADAASTGSIALLGAARDEQRLTALGRRTVEVFVVSHLFLDHLATAFWDAECTRRQDALIQAEEAHEAELDARTQAKAAADRERKLRKKAKRKAKQMVEAVERQAEDAEAAASQEAARAEVAAQRLARAQAASAAAVAAAAAATAATVSTSEALGSKRNGARAGPAANTTSACHNESKCASVRTESHQVRQLLRQVVQMSARIAEQDCELDTLRAQVAALRMASDSRSAAQPSTSSSHGGPARLDGVQVSCSSSGFHVAQLATGIHEASESAGEGQDHNRSAASSQDSGSSVVLRPSTPAAALDGSGRLSGLDSRDSSALGSPTRCHNGGLDASHMASGSSRGASPAPTTNPTGCLSAAHGTDAVSSVEGSDSSSTGSISGRGSNWLPAGKARGSFKAGTACRAMTIGHGSTASARSRGHACSNTSSSLIATGPTDDRRHAMTQLRASSREGQAPKIVSVLNKDASLFVPAATKRSALAAAPTSPASESAMLHSRGGARRGKASELPSYHSAATGGRGRSARGGPRTPAAPLQTRWVRSQAQRSPASLTAQPLPSGLAVLPPVVASKGPPFLQSARSALLPSLGSEIRICGHHSAATTAVPRSSSTSAICLPATSSMGLSGNDIPVLEDFPHIGLITYLFN